MQFAVALIEYLISGIVAMAWIAVLFFNLLGFSWSSPPEVSPIYLVALFPIAYILGIFVDTFASLCIRRIKQLDAYGEKFCIYANPRNLVRRFFYFIGGQPKGNPYKRTAKILAASPPDLVRAMEASVIRDRIARGMALNSFIAIPVVVICSPSTVKPVLTVACGVAFVVSILAYRRLRRLSVEFKTQALASLYPNG